MGCWWSDVRPGATTEAPGWAVASSVFFNLALLGFFKYWDFLAASFQAVGLNFMPVLGIHLPIGISFYTFQTMSYTIDVYRGDARAQRSLVNFGTFVTLFPQLIAGPIIKYKDLGDQIDQPDLHRGEVCLRRPDVRHRPGQKGAHRQQRGHAVGELQGHGAGGPDRGRGLAGRAGLCHPDLL